MPSTNKTPKGLSQFDPADIPKWLEDYNGDMSKLDGMSICQMVHTYASSRHTLTPATEVFTRPGLIYFTPTVGYSLYQTFRISTYGTGLVFNGRFTDGTTLTRNAFVSGGVALAFVPATGSNIYFLGSPAANASLPIVAGDFAYSDYDMNASITVGSEYPNFNPWADSTIFVQSSAFGNTIPWSGEQKSITISANGGGGQPHQFNSESIIDSHGSIVRSIPPLTNFFAQISDNAALLKILTPFSSNNNSQPSPQEQEWKLSPSHIPVYSTDSSRTACNVTRYKDFTFTMNSYENTDFVRNMEGGLLSDCPFEYVQWVRVTPMTVRTEQNNINEQFFGVPLYDYAEADDSGIDFVMPATAIQVYVRANTNPQQVYMKFLVEQCPFLTTSAVDSGNGVTITFRVEIGSLT